MNHLSEVIHLSARASRMYLSFQKAVHAIGCSFHLSTGKCCNVLVRSCQKTLGYMNQRECSPPSSLTLLTSCIFAGLHVWSAAKRWKTLARCWRTSSPSCQPESCPQLLSPFPTRRKNAPLPQASNSSATTPVSCQAPRPLQLCGVMMWLKILRQPRPRALARACFKTCNRTQR